MWSTGNSIENHGVGEGKLNGKSSEREKNHERLMTTVNKLRAAGRKVDGRWGDWVMGINEGM